MISGRVDPIVRHELGEHSFWLHNTGYLYKPLSTRIGVAGRAPVSLELTEKTALQCASWV